MTEPPRQTDFSLPFGVLDRSGTVHREGVLRLPTQDDLIVVLSLANGVREVAYLEKLLLARMLVRLGTLPLNDVTRYDYVGGMVLPDIDHLNEVYRRLAAAAPEPGGPG